MGPPSKSDAEFFLKNLKPGIYELFKRCTQSEQNKKMEMIEMLKLSPAFHKLKIYDLKDLENASDLICECLKWNPKERISAENAIKHEFLNQD